LIEAGVGRRKVEGGAEGKSTLGKWKRLPGGTWKMRAASEKEGEKWPPTMGGRNMAINTMLLVVTAMALRIKTWRNMFS
jgi:hypothetical protein